MLLYERFTEIQRASERVKEIQLENEEVSGKWKPHRAKRLLNIPGGDTICENRAINLVKASTSLQFGKGEASACTSPPFGS